MQQKTSSNHIDKNIIILLLSVMVISIGVFSYKLITHDPCQIVNFEINASQFRVGEIIRFKDYSENADKREWLFGDESEPRYTENPFHTYDKPGKYSVKLIVNDKCEFEKEIVIKAKQKILDSTRLAKFTIPNTIEVGQLLQATDQTKKATSWEWLFGETAEVNSTFQNPTYTYETPGLKTVTLIVNGDFNYSTQKKITVLPKKVVVPRTTNTNSAPPIFRGGDIKVHPDVLPTTPPPVAAISNEPEEVTAPQISRSSFAQKIIKVGEEKATANDFEPYLCGNLDMVIKDKGKNTTFKKFCEKIKGKKLRIKSLELFKNKETDCIEFMSITYSKSLF